MFFSLKSVLSVLALSSNVLATPIAGEAAAAAPAAEATPPPGYNSIFRCELFPQGSDRQRNCYLSAYASTRQPTPTVIVYPQTQWDTYPAPRETVVVYGDRNPNRPFDRPDRPDRAPYGQEPYANNPYGNQGGGTVVVYQPTRPANRPTVPVGYQPGPTIGAPNWN